MIINFNLKDHQVVHEAVFRILSNISDRTFFAKILSITMSTLLNFMGLKIYMCIIFSRLKSPYSIYRIMMFNYCKSIVSAD